MVMATPQLPGKDGTRDLGFPEAHLGQRPRALAPAVRCAVHGFIAENALGRGCLEERA